MVFKLVAKSNLYNALRLAAGLLTVLALIAHQYIPNKTLVALPNESLSGFLYSGDAGSDGYGKHSSVPSSYWIDKNANRWSCHFKVQDNFSCGYSLSFGPSPTQGIDLSGYDGFKVKLKYRGDASLLRIYMRNYDDNIVAGDPTQSSKFQSTIIRTSNLKTETLVKFNEFSVAQWWIRDFDVARNHAAPQRNNIVTFGFDFVTYGEHELELENVTFVGDWVQSDVFYLTILCIWMVLVIWEGFSRFYQIYLDSRLNREKIYRLQENYKQLKVEKDQFKQLSTTDVLTGVMNRAGLLQVTEKVFSQGFNTSGTGFMILDLDNFKRINDTHGHDVGDRVLQGVAKVISENIRQSDFFGRWGGEEFVVICSYVEKTKFRKLAEKLRKAVSNFSLDLAPPTPLKVTISIGLTMGHKDDTLDDIFKRADFALYEAKSNGRNCIIEKEVA